MIALLTWLLGCAAPLNRAQVTYGPPADLPMVNTRSDAKRWYVVLDGASGPSVWLIDTGYGVTTCHSDFIETLGIDTQGRVLIKGVVGRVNASRAKLPPVTLGTHRLKGLVCAVRDLHQTSSLRPTPELPLGGVLGMDIWRHFQLSFDPEAGLIALAQAAPPDDSSQQIKLRGPPHRRPYLPLRSQSALQWVLLDTGATRSYVEPQSFSKVHTLPGVTLRGTGPSGSKQVDLHVLALEDAWLAGTALASREVFEVTPGSTPKIGLDVLRHYRLELNAPYRSVALWPVQTIRLRRWNGHSTAGVFSPR